MLSLRMVNKAPKVDKQDDGLHYITTNYAMYKRHFRRTLSYYVSNQNIPTTSEVSVHVNSVDSKTHSYV